MLTRLLNKKNTQMKSILDNVKLLAANLSILGVFTFANVELVLRVTVLVVTLSYTIWKFASEYKKRKK